MKKIAITLAGFALVSAFAFAKAEKDIVDTAVGAGQFKTLAKLVTDAGLVETLKGKGPFTVFAPTDAAFAKLPKSVVTALTNDKKLLTQVLTYHVIAGKVMSTDLKDGLKAKTVQGSDIHVMIKGTTVKFNKSGLVKADIGATNGVIHVIDTVLVPDSVAKALKSKKH
ncbi:MAG TPA: fasciclin domain-containing protein [Fimbriimonadaceae bacterium]|nr:fasciclin domain-containing protein [Fimbriimonadaceae bacterium]